MIDPRRQQRRPDGEFLRGLLPIDQLLEARGAIPPLTSWWLLTLTAFEASGARRFVGRVGRGGAKSHTAVKVGLGEVLTGSWNVPFGERHYFAFISQNKSEASQRLAQLESALRVLQIPFDRRGDSIDLQDLPLGFRVFACAVGAVSGFRCIGFVADEIAKWANADDSVRQAVEVVASIRAMTVTHPNALEWFISSPLSMHDYHYELFEKGTTEDQFTAWAPSWVANPSITEAETRKLESDPRVHAREYRAIPQEAKSAALDRDAVLAAFRAPLDAEAYAERIGIIDFSSGRSDAATMAVVSWRKLTGEFLTKRPYLGVYKGVPTYGEPVLVRENGEPVRNPSYDPVRSTELVFSHVEAETGSFWESLPADQLVAHQAAVFKRHGVRWVFGDQREAFTLAAEYARNGLRFVSIAWTNQNKQEAVERARRWLRDRQVVFSGSGEHFDRLQRELLSIEEKILPTGAITYGARSGQHDDYASLLLTAAMADAAGYIPNNPRRKRRRMPNLPQQ